MKAKKLSIAEHQIDGLSYDCQQNMTRPPKTSLHSFIGFGFLNKIIYSLSLGPYSTTALSTTAAIKIV